MAFQKRFAPGIARVLASTTSPNGEPNNLHDPRAAGNPTTTPRFSSTRKFSLENALT
jgi:hypothetical protein